MSPVSASECSERATGAERAAERRASDGVGESEGRSPSDQIDIRRLGRVDYADALDLQRDLVERRKQGLVPDQLLLLEHPDVITFGVRSRNDRSHLLATPEALAAEGVSVFETGRGGDVTFHGPGQLVGYPIFDLKPDRCDVHRYVRDLEEALIRAVGEFDIRAGRVKGLTGIWVGPDRHEAKLAAIGVRISRWVTSHGFALNVSTNLSRFGLIVPCGITDRGVTSIEQLLARPIPMAEVEDAVIRGIQAVFSRRPVATNIK